MPVPDQVTSPHPFAGFGTLHWADAPSTDGNATINPTTAEQITEDLPKHSVYMARLPAAGTSDPSRLDPRDRGDRGRGRAAPWCSPCPGRGLDPRDRGDRGRGRCPIAAVPSESDLIFIE